DASLDAKGGVDDFSSRVFPTLLFHFLRPKSTLDERDELVRLLHGEIGQERGKADRDMFVRGHLATAEHDGSAPFQDVASDRYLRRAVARMRHALGMEFARVSIPSISISTRSPGRKCVMPVCENRLVA